MNRPNQKRLPRKIKKYKSRMSIPKKQNRRKTTNKKNAHSWSKDILNAAVLNFASALLNAFVIPVIPEHKKLVAPTLHLKKDKDGVYKPNANT